MKKITLSLFLGCTILGFANFSKVAGINPVKPKKNATAPFAAVNDNCESAIAITSFPYSNTQTDGVDALNDGFVTVCTDGGEMNDGLWYSIEGNGNSIIITVTPDDEDYDFELGVFSGSCGAFECLGTSDSGFSGEAESYSFQSEIGVTYYINIGDYSDEDDNPESNFTIEVDSFQAPVNDNCAGAIEITSFPYSNEQTDGVGASADGFVEACEDSEMNDGLWYAVIGDGNNIEIAVTTASGYDVAIGAFTGSCDAFTCVETVDEVSSGQELLVINSSEVGTVYYINVGYYGGFTDMPEGNFTIEVDSVIPPEVPVNDNCAGALEITSFPYFNEQTDGAAATEDGLLETCVGWEMNDGLWYSVIGDGNNLEITVTTGEEYDIALGYFTGSCDALACGEVVDDVYSGEEFLVIPSSEVGTVYYINVGNYDFWDDMPEGNFTIEVNSVVPPDPADCSPAAIFPLNNATDVPVGVMEFTWEVPTTGGPVDSYDLYGGTTTPLTEADLIDNYEENSASINIAGFSTVFYWKAVPRNAGGQAADCIEWTFTTVEAPPAPANDACDTATPIASFPFNEEIDATSATNNEGTILVTDCGTGMNDGIWYSVEGNGSDIVINATSMDWDGELAVYTGACGDFVCYDSTDAGSADDTETITITASEIGTVYYINFGHYDGSEDDAEGQAIIEVTSDDLSVGDNNFKNFTVYPNPVKDILNLSYTENISNVEVFNLLGQKMLAKSIDANQGPLDLSGLATGSYLVKVTSGSETKTIKVLKQ